MRRLDPVLISEVLAAWRGAPWGGRGPVLAQHLPLLGLSEAAFYRLARQWRGPEAPARERRPGKRADARREDWVRAIIQVKYRPPNGVRALTTEDAQRLTAAAWEDPAEAEEISTLPRGTIDRIARELGLTQRPRRENRFEAAYANQVHQLDASGSEHFFPWRQDNGGQWLLKLRPRRTKNREMADGLRVWAYGLCDDFSGYRLARYTVAPGESALEGISFLQWAWSRLPIHAPFEGVPEILYMDNGPVAKLLAFKRFCESVLVTIQTHEPYRSQATGKVEQNWRTAWRRFENLYFADPGWGERVISLTELNQEFARFWQGWNRQRPHRRLQLNREEAWLLVNRRGGAVTVAPEAWSRLAVQQERTLDAAGCFDLDGQTYQVKELWSVRVTVLRGLLDGAVWVREADGRERFRAEPWAPKLFGEFRGSPKSDLERLQEADEATAAPERPCFFPAGESNVVPLVRAGEVRQGEADSRAAVPGRRMPEAPSLDDLAGRVEVLPTRPPAEPEFARPLERYEAMLVKTFKGHALTPGEETFVALFRRDYRDMLDLVGEDLEKQARLKAVEGK